MIGNCGTCHQPVDTDTVPHARRGDALTCEACEWPEKPAKNPPTPNRYKDSTQGFSDTTQYGPPYPIHPEKLESILQQPINPRTKKPYPRDKKKRPSETMHRCDCGQWVIESVLRGSDGVKRIVECGGRGTLFGRYWCEACNAGHRLARYRETAASSALFDTTDSAELYRQLETHYRNEPENAQVVIYLTTHHKKWGMQVKAHWRFADWRTAYARLGPYLKIGYRKQMEQFIADNPK